MPRAASAVCLVAIFVSLASGAEKLFVDMGRDELVKAAPDLAAMQFDASQDSLDTLLRATGEKLANMFENFADASMAETIHEMRFEGILLRANRPENFLYFAQWITDADNPHLQEFRADARTGTPVTLAAQDDVLVSGRFVELLNCLLPRAQSQFRFRSLGRVRASGRDLSVVAFAQRSPAEGSPRQGLVWIDAAANTVARLRVEGASFDAPTIDVSFALVKAPSAESAMWLPSQATLHARAGGIEFHTVHRYSAYRLDDRPASTPSGAPPAAEDAYELLARAIALEDQPAEAAPLLRQALQLDPAVPQVHYWLAVALRASGDATGAEAELRQAAQLAPDLGPVHNLLGMVLAKRDLKAAAVEFRLSAQLLPKDAVARFHYGQVLEKLGDRVGALEEYRAASVLDPGNAVMKSRYEQLTRAPAPAPAAPAATIRVEVRQVMVPVVVTDREGHHIPGLTRADFQVFEDGVEQKISGFGVESVAATAAASEPAAIAHKESAAPRVQPQRASVRRTYLICLDTLHAEFGNLVHVREALSKLFAAEQPGDAQYIVVAVGRSTELLQNTTSDAGSVLKAIQSKSFEKLYLASTRRIGQSEMLRYRRELDEVRALCDAGDPSCPARKQPLPGEAQQIAIEDRMETTAFLRQLRSLVQQLAQGTDRRTVVLLSDGFQMVPGREAFDLLTAYFPEIPFISLRTIERIQDELEPVLRMAANSNITFHTVDTRGLYTQEFFSAANPGGSARMLPAVLNAMNRSASEAGDTLVEIAAHRRSGLQEQQRYPPRPAKSVQRWARVLHARLYPRQSQSGRKVPRHLGPAAEERQPGGQRQARLLGQRGMIRPRALRGPPLELRPGRSAIRNVAYTLNLSW
jgi:VWFA-related protein